MTFYVTCYKDLNDKCLVFAKSEIWYAGRFLTELALSEMNGYTNDIFCNVLFTIWLHVFTITALYQLPLTSVNGQEMPQFPGGL